MTDPTQSPEWAAWPLTEKLVQLAAYHCDVLHVQEVPIGSNRGPWVDRYLESAGAEPGEPWCASFVTYLLKQCGYPPPVSLRSSGSPTPPGAGGAFPVGPAAVINWSRWAEHGNRIVADPGRGDLFFLLHANGQGHIGIVLGQAAPATIRTIEGNSNPGGSREGYEVVRRERPVAGLRFIRL